MHHSSLTSFLWQALDNICVRLAASHGISLQDLSINLSIKSFVNMLCGPVFALISSELPATFLFTIGSFRGAAAITGIAFSVSPAGYIFQEPYMESGRPV